MRLSHILAGAVLIAAFAGCSKDSGAPLHSVATTPSFTDSNTTQARIEALQKEYGVTVSIHDRWITIGTMGLITTNKASQISDALREALGNDFTNYTINYDIN